jgi:hypothetical protein
MIIAFYEHRFSSNVQKAKTAPTGAPGQYVQPRMRAGSALLPTRTRARAPRGSLPKPEGRGLHSQCDLGIVVGHR